MTALAVPEEFDGIGAHPADLAVAFIELGRAAVPGPVLETAAAVPALLSALNDQQLAKRFLPGIAEGNLASLVLEPSTPRALDADVAEPVLRVSGDTLELVRPTTQLESVDPARRLFEVESVETLAQGADVAAAAEKAYDLAVLAASAQLIGAGHAMIETATDYAKNRSQFGRVIGSFQAVKHHMSDALVAVEMATPLVYGAAISIAEGSDTIARDVSAAKVAAANAAYVASRKALQVHGAIGYTLECDLSLWLTKTRALQSAWGTASAHRARIASAL
ncbi:putative acyl-CoA dehydrogenase FadE [Prescottella equi]|nr:putative acyl-CoA dehydrogenase FadE [Prescottella equi]BCN57379.1 putative acyl-CoA dehydrogenase FadE [Prescottella equi]BCN62302.1 putative acyl-CoA dehydrogenase FadE [Prescottella equi]BCN72154.1 putative acyl-CoA dehydrogenase FadE [Prescottella equi]BCN82114.1 putative acyl-CoA dehydrogenase FadE [Prescottella equi]